MIDTGTAIAPTLPVYSEASLFVEPFLPEFGFAVDVGANDGLFLSNSILFERKGWTVLCIEPNPEVFEDLSANRKHFLRCAAGRSHHIATFFSYGQYPHASWSGFHPEIAASHGITLSHADVQVQVPVFTLTELLCASCFPKLDLLTIDTEGDELNVLAGLDFDLWQPRIIIAEFCYGPDSTNFLAANGYRLIKRIGEDNIYQRSAPF